MVLNKIVSDLGVMNVTIDGKELDFALSRELTGTTGEAEQGIFEVASVSETFDFGDFRATINFHQNLDFTWHIDDIADIISSRIIKVRQWVQDCKDSGGRVVLLEKGIES